MALQKTPKQTKGPEHECKELQSGLKIGKRRNLSVVSYVLVFHLVLPEFRVYRAN